MIKIPEKVKVGYMDYDVKVVEGPVVLGNSVCYGTVLYDRALISISAEYPEKQQQCAFIHEALHAIEQDRGLKLKESDIEALAKGIYMLILDNPDIFK